MAGNIDINLGGVVDGLFKGLDSLFTSDEEKSKARLAMQVELQKPHILRNGKHSRCSASELVRGRLETIHWVVMWFMSCLPLAAQRLYCYRFNSRFR